MDLSGVELFGWTGLLLLVCLWFFVLGVLVGRGMVPVTGIGTPLEKELAQARQESLKQKEAEAEVQAQVRIDFHEALKEDKARPLKIPAPLPPAADKVTPAAPTPAVQAKPPASETPPVKAASADAEKMFTIQVAAIKDPRAAQEMIEKLKKKGFDAYSIKAELADGVVWHRIRCGAFESREAAGPLLSNLKEAGYGPVLVPR